MDVLQSLKNTLRPLRLYRFTGDTLVECELAAYASVLQPLEDAIETLERELFVSTAQDYGLLLREEAAGRRKPQTSLESRREMLIYRMAVTSNDFTRESMERALVAAGIRANMVEQPDRSSVYINCIETFDPFVGEEQIEKEAEAFLPAHLNAEFDFRPLSWDYIEDQGLTFDQMDAKSFSWQQIDQYQGGSYAK